MREPPWRYRRMQVFAREGARPARFARARL